MLLREGRRGKKRVGIVGIVPGWVVKGLLKTC